jgi:hypothetical protein
MPQKPMNTATARSQIQLLLDEAIAIRNSGDLEAVGKFAETARVVIEGIWGPGSDFVTIFDSITERMRGGRTIRWVRPGALTLH